MASSTEAMMRWRQDLPNRAVALGLPLLIFAGAIWVGVQAKAATAELGKREVEWQRAAEQMATVQQQFRVPSSTESAALIAESSRLGALGVPARERVPLMEFLVNLAEASTLNDVRVNFAAADTIYAPSRSIAGEGITRAPYSVTLDFTGGFAGLVQFVSSLPPSVTISRLSAGRRGTQTNYHMILSVYELPNVNKGG